MWAYDEATKAGRVFVPVRQRECQRTDYDSRRTGNRLLDTGSIPVRSIKKVLGDAGCLFCFLKYNYFLKISKDYLNLHNEVIKFKITNEIVLLNAK